MAKQPQQQPNQPVPYPKNWGKLNAQQKHDWMRANRPGYKDAAPAAPATAPTGRQQQQPGGQQRPTTGADQNQEPFGDEVPTRIKVALWAVKVGDRDVIECAPADLGSVITSEQAAYTADQEQQPPAPGPDDQGADDGF